ncbi:tetratricopeptide repeat protein [Hyphomicrobium sp.]|jgi:Flp pilus assembly protein TadD|uniref:tetratricopeptide repeat protein n=1 Tax=Hyphomicrobium sp. TaxID=82 RepID=UPI002CF18BEA|nr:tetratricopeptide repeat protein [Hyphomicrobium sp.]HVZ03258.1 tetratricopeptide repeat protein [Hyphomicrobium sp.]
MKRNQRPRHLVSSQPAASTRLGVIASLTASLLLGACSQSPSLLQDIALKPETTNSTDTSEPGPRTELQKATIYWGKEYAKQPTALQPALNYARDLKALGEKEKALYVLQQASMIHGHDQQLTSEYGRLALELNQINVAGQLLAAADDPTRPDWRVISARGTVMAKQGKYADAIPFYQRALALSPDNPTIMNNLAMAHAMMGDPKKAEQLLRQALATSGATPKMRENLALVLGLQGRYDESRSVASSVLDSATASSNASYLKQLVKLDPKSEMPDAKSFMAQTSIAQSAPAAVPNSSQFATSVTPTDDARSNWQTVSATAAPLRGMTH